MNLAKVVTDCVTLESDVLALGTDPAAVKVATDVAVLLSDFGLDNSLHNLGGPFDRFQDFTAAIAQYRSGSLDAPGLLATLAAPASAARRTRSGFATRLRLPISWDRSSRKWWAGAMSGPPFPSRLIASPPRPPARS